jgi:hypothetical protein
VDRDLRWEKISGTDSEMALVGDIIVGTIARCIERNTGWVYALDNALIEQDATRSGDASNPQAARLLLERGWASWLLSRDLIYKG